MFPHSKVVAHDVPFPYWTLVAFKSHLVHYANGLLSFSFKFKLIHCRRVVLFPAARWHLSLQSELSAADWRTGIFVIGHPAESGLFVD